MKGKLCEMEFKLQRTKEENLRLITALKLISNNLSEPTKTTDDNSPRSHNHSKLHFTSPTERCPLQTSNPIEVPQEARENQSSCKSLDNQIDNYRAKQKNLYAERCSLQTSNPAEVPQEAREINPQLNLSIIKSTTIELNSKTHMRKLKDRQVTETPSMIFL